MNRNNIKIICDDFFDVDLPTNYFQLIFTSPPYNVGINYDNYDDFQSWDKYLDFLTSSLRRSVSLTRPGGYVVFNIFDGIKYINFMYEEFKKLDESLKLTDLIPAHIHVYMEMLKMMEEGLGQFCLDYVWDQKVEDTTAWGSFKSPSAVRSRTNHEFIFGFQKAGESSSKGQTNEVSNKGWMELTRSVISIGTEPNRSHHPAPFPIDLPKYFIKLLTHKNDPVLDPFAGSLTTVEASRQLKREGWGVELSKSYIDKSRIKFPGLWATKKKVKF